MKAILAVATIAAVVSAEYKQPIETPCSTAQVKPTHVAPTTTCAEVKPTHVAPAPCTDSCPADRSYYAVLFDGDMYSDIKHWVDGKSGECRGLNGTDIRSIRHVGVVGGDPTRQRVSNEFANGVTLRFYDQWECKGNQVASPAGNVPSTLIKKALSVKIECNGKGVKDQSLVPVTDAATIQVFKECSYTGEMSQTDGLVTECRGLSGLNPVSSMRFMKGPASTEVLSDAKASEYAVAFFSEWGCAGQKLGELVGNTDKACDKLDGKLCKQGAYPKSVMFYKSDPKQRMLSSEQSSAAAAGTSMAAGALAALVALF
jgi:hypothetical protein